MSYDPVAKHIREKYQAFVKAAEDEGFSVGQTILHSDKELEEGEDVEVSEEIGVVRYWPHVGYDGAKLTVTGKPKEADFNQ
jgi:hypothetical protein